METLFQRIDDLDPEGVELYLRANEWERSSPDAEYASFWTLPPPDADVELVVPKSRVLGDFYLRLDDLLRTLEQVEARPRDKIILDVVNIDSDVFEFIIGDEEAPDLERQALLFASARDLVAAAAGRVSSPAGGKSESGAAVRYLRHVRAYAIEDATAWRLRLALPVLHITRGESQRRQVWEEDLHIGQRASQFLTEELDRANDAVTAGPVQGEGAISAASAHSLAQIIAVATADSVRVTVAESLARTPAARRVREFTFSRSAVPALESATQERLVPSMSAPHIRRAEDDHEQPLEIPGSEIQGRVLRLERPYAVIPASVLGRARRVKVTVPTGFYEAAVLAHLADEIVRVHGTLVVPPRGQVTMPLVEEFERPAG